MVFLTLLVVLPASSPPTVTIFDSTSNVYGRAYPAKDSGVVRFLGTFNTTAGCQHACVGYHAAKDGAVCHSFTFHHADFPQAAFAGACFAIADHSWQPNSPADKITSGRVAWPMDGCGAGAASGCLWQVDPICLASGGDMTLQPVQLTVARGHSSLWLGHLSRVRRLHILWCCQHDRACRRALTQPNGRGSRRRERLLVVAQLNKRDGGPWKTRYDGATCGSTAWPPALCHSLHLKTTVLSALEKYPLCRASTVHCMLARHVQTRSRHLLSYS